LSLRKKPNPQNIPREQRRQADAATLAANVTTEKPESVQASIPYLAMYPDGVCRVTERLYSKSIEFFDVNYMLAGKDEQTAIFEGLCDFYNYFDPSISVQETFISRRAAKEEFYRLIDIPHTTDGFDRNRDEFGGILKSQLEKGSNGLVRTKYLTFAIETDSLKMAQSRLARIELDLINHFKLMGAGARPLSGKERLAALHSVLHLGTTERFRFEWDGLYKTGLSTKDFIAPTSFHFGEGRSFRIGGQIGAVSFLQIIAPELSDRILADFLELDGNVVVNLHIRSIEQAAAVKMVKRKITDIDGMRVNEQKKAVRSGYDMEIMPTDLNTYGDEAKKLLKDLQSRNEKMFLITVLTMNMAGTKQTLDNRVFQMSGIAQKNNCALYRLDYMQEQGLMSSLPLGLNTIPIQRGLTTSGVAVFIPFITREIFQGGEALNYGRNAIYGNMIMADRKQLRNPKGLQCKGRLLNRKYLRAVKPFAAQVERHGQEKGKRGNNSRGFLTYESTARKKYFQKLFEKGSDLPPVFLLLVEGYCNPMIATSDYAPKTRERRYASVFYHNQDKKPTTKTKGANPMKNRATSEVKPRANAEPPKFQMRIGSTVYSVSVHYSRTSEETVEDKIIKLIESEARKIA